MQSTREVVSVTVHPICYETYPCQHDVELVILKNGTQRKIMETMSGSDIARLLFDKLTETEKVHFSEYIR